MALNAALGDLIDNFRDSLNEWMYSGVLTNANGAAPVNHDKPDFTLPKSVITYYKTHQSGLQGTS